MAAPRGEDHHLSQALVASAVIPTALEATTRVLAAPALEAIPRALVAFGQEALEALEAMEATGQEVLVATEAMEATEVPVATEAMEATEVPVATEATEAEALVATEASLTLESTPMSLLRSTHTVAATKCAIRPQKNTLRIDEGPQPSGQALCSSWLTAWPSLVLLTWVNRHSSNTHVSRRV